ncbi:hypothetical protein Q7C36_013570 [Tachysurus vachellii]|uniref:Uncharacterized protein n=1 Tax=Tachysurus vachellii TaxID=175792 RepID=A0AA88SJJ2_TACVA|nr:hypothetical protein Q7C36_013570 [Tachysurus vachellii]
MKERPRNSQSWSVPQHHQRALMVHQSSVSGHGAALQNPPTHPPTQFTVRSRGVPHSIPTSWLSHGNRASWEHSRVSRCATVGLSADC